MAGQPSGPGSEGVVTLRHPRALDEVQAGWISPQANRVYATQQGTHRELVSSFRTEDRSVAYNRRTCLTDFPQPVWNSFAALASYAVRTATNTEWSSSFRADDRLVAFRRRTCLTDFPQDGWIGRNSGKIFELSYVGFITPEPYSFRTDRKNVQADKRYGTPFSRQSSLINPAPANSPKEQLLASYRLRDGLWTRHPAHRQSVVDTSWIVQVTPQKPFVTAQWPSVAIPAERTRARSTLFIPTQPDQSFITANLVAPTFSATWLAAMFQLTNSIRNQYVQELTMSPGLYKGGSGGGAPPPPIPFNASTYPWTTDSVFMPRGKQWPKLTDQKSPYALLDVAKVYAVWSAQANSFLTNTPNYVRDSRFRQVDWNIGSWVNIVTQTTFDPIQMCSNTVTDDFRMGKGRKWYTSDPAELSWLIPPVLYAPALFLHASSAAQWNSFRSWALNKNIQHQQEYPGQGWLFTATPAFNPTGMAWPIQGTYPNKRTNFTDRRQHTYDPDQAWNVFRPEVIDWHLNDTRMATIHAKVQTQQSLSDLEMAFITANVPAIDPTIWIAVVQQLNSERARGVYRDVRTLTEMVQLSWLFDPLDLDANIPAVVIPPVIDLDPHFTSPSVVTPYWLVYPRRTRHRKDH